MEHLVGVGVADAREDPWVREHPLQRPVLPNQSLAEGREGDLQRLEAPWVELLQCLATPDQVQGRLLPDPPLREEEGLLREVEGGVGVLLRYRRPGLPSVKATRDHEVDHQVQFALQVPHDPLTQSGHGEYAAARSFRKGGIEGPHEGGGADPDGLQGLVHDPGAKGLQVRLHLGELWHQERMVPGGLGGKEVQGEGDSTVLPVRSTTGVVR